MSIFNVPKQIATKIIDTLSPSWGQKLRQVAQQPQENDDIHRRLAQLEAEVVGLRDRMETLNGDLDESRRLNLRASEIMDITFTQLAK